MRATQIRDHGFGGFRRGQPRMRPRRRSATEAQRRDLATVRSTAFGAGKTGPIHVNAVLRTKACKTKPIGRGRAAMAEGRQRRPCPWLGRSVPNEANSYLGKRGRRTGEVTGGAVVGAGGTNKPNLPTRDTGWTQTGEAPAAGGAPARLARQTKPIPGGPAPVDHLGRFGVPPWDGKDQFDPRKRGTPNRNMRNKPNRSGTIRRASALRKMSYGELDTQQTSAKQSQFPPGPQQLRVGRAADDNDETHRAKQSQSCSDRKNGCQLLRCEGASRYCHRESQYVCCWQMIAPYR